MKRTISRWLALIYIFTNVLCAYAGETNYWEERRQAVQRRSSPNRLASFHAPRSAELVATGPIASLGTQQPGEPMSASHRALLPGMEKDWGWLPELVAPYGEIREIHVSSRPGAPVVFHLQDVHEVEEAQKNLAGLVGSFQKQRGISLVGLEGAVGPFGLDFFREGPLDVRKKLSDHFLKLGYLTGPEVAGIVAETTPTLWGIEDLSLYRGHVEAFERSEAGRTQARQLLTALSKEADKARDRVYSPALRALDDHRRAYVSQRESLGDYVPALWAAVKTNKKAYPQVALLANLLTQERALDFKEGERQRVRLAEVLAQRLDAGELDNLVKASLAYRAGRQTAGDYQTYLASVCRQNDIRLDTFGPLAAYMTYVQGADALDSGKLLDELDRLELAALTDTAQTNEEKKVVVVFRDLALLDKLTNHGLTPQEWGVLKKSNLSLENLRSTLTKINPTSVSKPYSSLDLSPYNEFCKKAEQRNAALLRNLLAKMKTDKANAAVLVAGGFHTDGMTALLKEANASYVVITPKISKVPDTRPLDILVRAPLPLEKLLAGDVIHLAYPRLTQTDQGTLAAAKNAIERRDNFMKAWLISLKNGQGEDRKSTPTLLDRVRSALSVARVTGLFKELRFFVPPVLGILSVEFVASALGLTGGVVIRVLVGLIIAILYWPKFLRYHAMADSQWLAENPGKTSSDYRRNLFIAYGVISLVTVGAMILFSTLGVAGVETRASMPFFEETGRAFGAIVAGGVLFHGIYNFLGRLFGGSAFVPAMAELSDDDEFNPAAYLKKYREDMARGPSESALNTHLDFTVAGYRFPAPFGWEISQGFEKKDVRSHARDSSRPLEEVVIHSADRAPDQDKRRWLMGRFVALGKLLDANKKVLSSLQPQNREQAKQVLVLVREMGSAYRSLAKGSSYLEESEDLPEFKQVFDLLTDGFEKKLKELSPGALIGEEVRELIITPTDHATAWSNVQTLHKLINLMHQRGESRFDAAARKVEGNMDFSVNGIGFSVANLDDRPLFNKGRPVSLPLSIIIKATRNAQQPPAQKPRLIVTGNYLQGSIQMGAHSANFSALVSPLAEGGRVRLTYTEVVDRPGNKMRLRFLVKLLEQFGMKVKLTDDFHLSAVFDKDNGEINKIEIPEVLDLMVRALYYSSGLDYAFEEIINKRASDHWWSSDRASESVLEEIEVMVRAFYAEGAIPFFTPYKSDWGREFSRNIQSYVNDEPQRVRLRDTLNSILHGCGLIQIPEDRPLGQKVIDDFFVEPLRAAVARGEVVVVEGRARRVENYNPVGDLARSVAKTPDPAMQLANRLGLYDARSLGLRPIGTVGQLSAGTAQWSIGEGRWLVLFGLYHPETGRILYATAQQVIENSQPQTIRVNEAEGILTEAGVIVLDNQDFNRSFMLLAEKLLRSPPRVENMPGFVCYGQGASSGPGWPVAGMASFDPQYRSPPGKKLPFFVVPRLEAHQIELMEAAGGFLVPNGLITSHAFVTLREGDVPGVVVSDAQWISGDSKPTLVVPIWRPRAAVMSEEDLWISEGVEEEGRGIEPGTVLLIDGERGAVSILSGDGMSETLGLWEGLSYGHATPSSVVASVADPSHFDRLEFVLFQAIWDRSVDEKTRQEIVGLLETVVAVMPEPYQRRFESLKQTHLDALVERARNAQVAARENRGWYNTVLEIQAMIEKIREQSLSVQTLARILSLQNPLIANLLLEEQEALVQSERLRARAQEELEAWAVKTLTPDDLPQIRKILKRAQLNGVNPNDVSYQHLAEMGRRFFEEKLKRFRETKRAVFAPEEVDIDMREDGSTFAHLGESKKIVENNDALVPKGMGLTPFGFEKYLVENGINRDFDRLVEQLDSLLEQNSIEEPQTQAEIKRISESIQILIKDHLIQKNGPLAEEIFKMIKILGLEKVLMMVRSNGAQEDGEKMAFAGGARSFSEVDLSHLLEKIQETWMSFWTPSAIAYRAHRGVKQADEKMGVIVQEYIKADVSGTLFTRNPSTGENDIFISAGRGSGKDVEASEVPSDEYAVRKSDGEEIGFPTVRNTPRALSQEQIKQLVRVANALENHFNHPLIIEYLFQEGRLFVLQVRYDTSNRNNSQGERAPPPRTTEPPRPDNRSIFGLIISFGLVFSILLGALNFMNHARAEMVFNDADASGAISFTANPDSESENKRLRDTVGSLIPAVPGAPIERDAVNNIAATLHDALVLDPSLAVELAQRVVDSRIQNLWLTSYSRLLLMMGNAVEPSASDAHDLLNLANNMFQEFPAPIAGVPGLDAWVLVLNVFEKNLPGWSNESQREGFVSLFELAHRIGEKGLMANDPANPLINRIEGSWLTLEHAREMVEKKDVPGWLRGISARKIARAEQEAKNADQNEDSSSPALVYLNNLQSHNKAELWADVQGWVRGILLGTTGTLEKRVFALTPLEAYVLMDVLSRPDPNMPVNPQLAAQVRAQLWVKLMAAFKAEFDQGSERESDRGRESPYGPLTLLAFFGDGFGQKAFIKYAIESSQWDNFLGMVPVALKDHVSIVARQVSQPNSAGPLGLLPLIGRPVYNFLIDFGANPRLAAGIAGFAEQGVLVLIAGGLAWLLKWIVGIGFIWGLTLFTAIIWYVFPKSHGDRVYVYEKFSALSGWDLNLVNVTADHLRSLRQASNMFFGSFLVVTLMPVILPLLGIAVTGSLEHWFYAGGAISSLIHGLSNSIKPATGKVAAMGSAPRWVQPTNGESIYRVPERRDWARINKALLDQTVEILKSLKISARSTVCSIGPGARIDNTTGPYGLTLERQALTTGSQVHVFERFDKARDRWTKFGDDNAIFGDSLHVHGDVRDAPNSMSARADAIFAFSVFVSPQADQNDREATLLKALDLLKPGGHLVVGWYNREPLYKSKTIEMLNSPLVTQRGYLELVQEGNTHPDSILSHGWAIYKWEPYSRPFEKSPYRENATRVLILTSLLWIAVGATGFGHSGDLMLLFGALLPLREIPPSANLPYDPNHPISWGYGSDHPGSAVVIGDADASFGAVKKILTSEGLVDEKDRWVGGRRVVVQVGDVVGRGQEPKELYEYLINIQAQARTAGGNLVLLLGNHEMALLMGQPIGGDFNEGQSSVRDELRESLVQWVKNGNIQCAAVLTNPKGKNYLVTHAGYSIRLKGMLIDFPVWQDWLKSESPQTVGTAPQDDVSVVQKFLNQAVVEIASEINLNSRADLTKKFRQYLNRSNGILLGSEGVLNRVAKFVDDGFLPVSQIIGHSVTSSVRFQDKENNVINTDSGLFHPDSQPGRSPMYLRLTGQGAVRAVEVGRFGERRSYRLTNGYNRPRPLNAWGWAVEIKDWMTLKLFPIYWLRLHVNHASTLEEMLASYHRFYTVLGRGRLPWHRRSRPEQWLESHRLVVNKLWADRASWRFVQLDGGENDLTVIMSNENRFDDLLDRARDVWKTIPGVVKGEVLPAFLASRNYQLYPVQEDAKGQLDLELESSPVAVSFQETGFLGVHEILIETDIDRIGLLADMTGAIAARGFSVLVGDVRVEKGRVLGRFDVGGLSMDAIERNEQRLALENDLSDLILGKIGFSDLFKRNGLNYEFNLTSGQGKPPSVVGFHDGNLTVLTPDRDRPGLLHVIARKLAELDCNISLAPHSIHTQGDTVFDFFKVVESNGESLSPQRKITVKNELEALLKKETITEDDFTTEENVFANRVVSELDRTIASEDFGRVDRALLGGEAGSLDVGRLTAHVNEIRTLVQNNRLQARLAREFLEKEMGEWELRGEDGQLSKQSLLQAGRSLGQAIRHRETGWENPLVQARHMTLAALVSLGESLAGEPEEKWAEWTASFAHGFNEDLYDVDELISSSLSSRRQIVLEVSETMLAGKPTEEEKSRLNEWAVLMARLNDMKDREVHWILPSESANLKELEEVYPNLAPLFSHRSTVFNKGLFRTEQGKYSVKNFLLGSQGKSRVADLESADLYLSSRDEWVLESDLPNDVVRILISLVGGLIYDATESVGTDLKRLYHLGTNA